MSKLRPEVYQQAKTVNESLPDCGGLSLISEGSDVSPEQLNHVDCYERDRNGLSFRGFRGFLVVF